MEGGLTSPAVSGPALVHLRPPKCRPKNGVGGGGGGTGSPEDVNFGLV